MSVHFQQSDFWCGFKCAHGWKLVSVDGNNVLVRTFRKFFVEFSFAYAPMIPEKGETESAGEYSAKIAVLAKKIKPALPKNTLCLRFDLPHSYETVFERDSFVREFSSCCEKFKIKKARVDVQPPDSTFIDLSLTEDEILSKMKSKWRYNVRYAKKHGVAVRRVFFDDENFARDLDSFYEIYRETSARDGIGLHPKKYYEDLLKRNCPDSQVTLYIASFEGEDLACIVTLFQKDEAVYLYGASGNSKRNLMPSYLVQWNAILDAKKFGSKIYDFYGIPPTNEENHPMHGLYQFKTGFGGDEIHRPGCFDVPLRKTYILYALLENFRAFWHKKVMKKIRGR